MTFSSETAVDPTPANDADATLAAAPSIASIPQADKLAILDTLKLVPQMEKLFTWSSLTTKVLAGVKTAKDGARK
jgi:hypothetical protein